MSSLTPRIDRFEKNFVINGNFDFWQRTTSYTFGSNNVYGAADRWHIAYNGPAGPTVQRSTNVPNSLSQYSMQFTSPATVGSYNFVFRHRIESTFTRELTGKFVTVSGWFLSNAATTITLLLQKPTAVDNYSSVTNIFPNAPKTIIANSTWQYFTWENIYIPDGTYGFELYFYTDNFAQSKQFNVSQIMLNAGSFANDEFTCAGRDYAEELQLCQRYFHKWSGCQIAVGAYNGGGGHRANMIYPVKMRTTPTISSNGGFGSDRYYEAYGYGATGTLSAESFYGVNADQFLWETGFSVGPLSNAAGRIIIQNNGYVQADAEL